MTHVKGPWDIGGKPGFVDIVNREGVTVASNLFCRDAALIAAAPEMLEALEQCITYYPQEKVDKGHCIRRLNAINALARAVIAKAKGE